ncbi:hypothetical protein SAY87_005015 [Trapa incisa]|uniref:SWI/SNF complex subunit SWI3B n=1 Tax=Trapa incisa TaxID=236973 RepID=A0AAN7PP58_9MYRT|nr:hypothetical protein SAY87_005015 [Trapa incisa]
MAAQAPGAGDHVGAPAVAHVPEPQPLPSQNLATTASPPVKEAPAAAPPPTTAEPPATEAETIHVPSYSRWFSWDTIHECELRLLPEFFNKEFPSRNPQVYLYYRDSIIKLYRQNPSKKITFTDARKIIIGDVGSIRKVFDFLETWGLINYSGLISSKPLKWDDKEGSKSGSGVAAQGGNTTVDASGSKRESARRVCNGCKSVCTIACFSCDKYELTLCARCYVRGNYQVGVSSADFRRVEINEEMKAEWTEKETLHLLEGLMHYGDDWRKVSQHVGSRSEKECVAQFVKLPFGEEFLDRSGMESNQNPVESNNSESGVETSISSLPNKRMCLTPLADASNPIMAQAAFLSALAGVEVTQAAAQAAVTTLSEVDYGVSRGNLTSTITDHAMSQDVGILSNGDGGLNPLEGALIEANSLLEKEENDLEKAISDIAEVQVKRIHDKIIEFEELDLLVEKERQQLDQLKDMLFMDQLMLLFHKNTECKSEACAEENAKSC